jgi:hypothetical protein
MSDKRSKCIYLAGILDGEGHITIQRSRTRNKRFRKDGSFHVSESRHYITAIGIINTDVRLMKWLVSNFGGNYSDKSSNRNHTTWKHSYQWFPTGGSRSKELLLLSVLPYLILKREQAILGLSNLRLVGESCPERRHDLYEKILALNKKGRTVETNTPSDPENGSKIESGLPGDEQSGLVVTQETASPVMTA